MSYEQCRSQIKTGDLILFSGKGAVSDIIKLFTLSNWSHIGMAVYSEEFDAMLIWESTTLGTLPDLETGKIVRGVQMCLLSDRIRSYQGGIGWRPLENADYVREGVGTHVLAQARKEFRDRPYEKSKLELIKSAYDGLLFSENQEDLSSLFCSELVAEVYQRWGLLGHDKSSNEYTPHDFSKPDLSLLGGASLGDIIHLRDS